MSSSIAGRTNSGCATSRSHWSRCRCRARKPLPSRLVVVSLPPKRMSRYIATSSSSVRASWSRDSSITLANSGPSPVARTRATVAPTYSRNFSIASSASRRLCSSREKSRPTASDHSQMRSRSSCGTPMRSTMTRTGSLLARSRFTSATGASTISATRSSTCPWIDARSASMRRAVKAREAIRRNRACSSPSLRLMKWLSKSSTLKNTSCRSIGSRANVPSANSPKR